MRSLTVKLVIGFTVVSLVGIALVAIMAARFTGDQFRELFENQNREALIADLASYYRQNGSWRGLDQIAKRPGFNQKYGWGFVVVDTQGRVVLGSPSGAQLSRMFNRDVQVDDGIPIAVDGNIVGTYYNLGLRIENRIPLPAQITRLYNSLILASVGAVIVSLILGVLLARSLTRTLRELTAATQKIAKGELEQQVPIRSKDELGGLAASFNQMSADLVKSRDLRRQMTADIAHELRTPLTVVLGHMKASCRRTQRRLTSFTTRPSASTAWWKTCARSRCQMPGNCTSINNRYPQKSCSSELLRRASRKRWQMRFGCKLHLLRIYQLLMWMRTA